MTILPIVSRYLAAGLLGVLLYSAWALVLQPAADYVRVLATSEAESRRSLEGYQRNAASLKPLLAALKRARAEEVGHATLSTTTPQLAAAEVQLNVRRLVSGSGGILKSTQMLRTRQEAGFRQVTLRVSIETGVDGLLQLLHGLESAVPYLVVGNVDIRARTSAAAGARGHQLVAAFDINAFMRVETP